MVLMDNLYGNLFAENFKAKNLILSSLKH